MSTLVDSAKLEVQQHLHRVQVLPLIILYLNNVCDSRCVTCSIWKNNETLRNPAERHMTDELLQELYATARNWRPRQILLSGGEPLLHPRFAEIVQKFAAIAPKVCLITNGLLLSSVPTLALSRISEFYISFDAADCAGYSRIRGVDGFERLAGGFEVLNSIHPRPRIVARCTLQHDNLAHIPELIESARRLGFDAISFLGVDVSSHAFARDLHGSGDVSKIQPTSEDLNRMESVIDSLGNDTSAFVEGGVDKLHRILRYFRALRGEADFPPVRCNAPWVSVVVETTGAIRGCFFQPVIGDFRTINGERAVAFRRALDVGTDPTCQRCVCSKLLGIHDFIRM
jgi:MoaA/NifB/PqqE/SkfB family radical SAM enzyme